jgi:glycine cleavage system regulatory protein
MTTLVLTVLGDDRPGLVDALSGLISDHGGSWERSQMSRLSGKFAGIVQVVVPDAQVDELQDALSALEADGALHVTVSGAGTEPPGGRRHYAVSLVGTDQPGLVHAISSALAAAGASIEELDTEITEAPMSGGPLFEAFASFTLPDSADIEDLRERLEDLAGHLMVDIELDR